jgi:arylsulfatase A-like enzyme
MLESMERAGILDRTLLVVLSDHGEDLWDHDATRSPGHGHSLYEEILHVPLLFRAPGIVPPGTRFKTPVSLLDVAPTILEMAGLPPDPRYGGRSLARSLGSGSEPEEVPVMAESIEYGPDRFSARSGNLKVILAPMPEQTNAGVHVQVRPLEVFDLAADPGERRDLSSAMPPQAGKLAEILWRRVEKVFDPIREKEGTQKIPEQLREQLRSLGYVH